MTRYSLYLVLALSLCLFSGGYANSLYSCKDKNGKVFYLSAPNAGLKCAEETIFPKQNQPAASTNAKTKKPNTAEPASNSNASAGASANIVPAVYVDKEKQKQRDKKRVDILLFELKKEINKKNLFLRRLANKESTSSELVDFYKNQLFIHQQNIVSVEKELSRMGVTVRYNQ